MGPGKKEIGIYLFSAVIGFGTCLCVSLVSGRKEAWDSPLYFMLGIPFMTLAITWIAYRSPTRVWRWVLAMAVGQSIAMVARNGSLSLWPLSVIAMTVCSIPQFVGAQFGLWLYKRKSV